MAEYKVIEQGAFADYEFEATARTIEDLFEICGMATFEAMADLSHVYPVDQYDIELDAENISELLYAFLAELIYLKDLESFLIKEYNISIDQDKKLYCRVMGERIDPSKHELKNDVKAVTYHHFELKRISGGYTAHILLDL